MDLFGRFTPTTVCHIDDLEDFIKSFTNKYVISYEDVPREHYHFAIFDSHVSAELLRHNFKTKFSAKGQVYISGKEIEKKLHAIAYTIKDGNYRARGLNPQEYLMAKQISFKKVKYDELVSCIEERYIKGDYSDKQLVKELILATVKCNKKVYLQHIKAHALLIKLKKESNKDKIDLLVERIIDDL